uniref:Uncharacterized protein n=1 Tax=Caenorhabditis japonica TaxID=281687 RepID=A0A8R1I5F1_CAEJA
MSSSSSKYPPLSSSTSSSSSLLRYRSGSVERSRVNTSTSSTSASSRDPAPYKTSYGAERGRSRDVSTSRMSRATSYDPFATSSSKTTRASSVIRTSGLSNSDYSSPRSALSSASRYGSTEQLNSSSYRSSYRFGSNSNSGATPSSSTYTPRNVRAGSVSIGAYDPPSSSLSRYRPTADTSSSSTYTPTISRYRSTDLSNTSDYSSKYRSPDNSTRCSSITSSRYSKPSPYSSRTSTSSSYRSDRDYRSMSRTDNEEEGDEVETTFRKLYRKYVTDSEPDLSRNVTSLADEVTRRFASKTPKKSKSDDDENSDLSISEGDEEDAEEGVLEKFREKGRLRRASSAGSITPRASVCNSPSKDVTPKCSPLPARKDPLRIWMRG